VPGIVYTLTSFQSPLRRAPRNASTLIRMSSCGEGAPEASVAQISLPSKGRSLLPRAPASASSVGMRSTMCNGSLLTPGLSLPGQLMIAGTRTPPSCSEPLPSRKLPFEAGALAPPLVLVNTITVLSRAASQPCMRIGMAREIGRNPQIDSYKFER
jgi:hypothetical protein